MIDATGQGKAGRFVLAPDHFRSQGDRKARRNSADTNEPELKPAQMAQPFAPQDSKPAPALPLRKPVAASSPAESRATRVGTAVPAHRVDNVAPPPIQPAAESGLIGTPPAPEPAPARKALPRVDLTRARELAGAMSGHGKRAFHVARSGMGKAASWSSRAAIWSGRQTRRVVSHVNRLISSNAAPSVDPLEQLASAGRYTAISNRFASLAELSEGEESAVRQGTPDRRIHQAGSDIALEYETTPAPMFVASGWACRIRVSRDGRRQIVGFLLPGDGIALSTGPGALANTTITALTSVETVSAEGVIAMARKTADFPGVVDALQRSCALDDEFLVNQIMRLGVSTVVERIGHLLLELHWRLGQAGLASATQFPLPISEDTMADALGLKPQAVKRVLSQLQSHGFIKRSYGSIHVMREDRLRAVCGFSAPITSVHSRSRRLMCDANAPATDRPRSTKTAANDELALRKRAPFDVVGQTLPKLDRHIQ